MGIEPEIKNADELKLIPCGDNRYKLSKTIDSSEWNKVSKYFGYHDDTVEPENTIVETYKYRGWAVYKNSVKEVEKILDISKENCVEYRDNEKRNKKKYGKRKRLKKELREKTGLITLANNLRMQKPLIQISSNPGLLLQS
ncbi:unnamed protein product [marine sediment metagenome]|uniref:Uncharacterized protein n=1 Tax=marine sediment metagenome TaxID=412755 RepID=X1IDF8_9ZZZZ